jgi:hypothetical protein
MVIRDDDRLPFERVINGSLIIFLQTTPLIRTKFIPWACGANWYLEYLVNILILVILSIHPWQGGWWIMLNTCKRSLLYIWGFSNG